MIKSMAAPYTKMKFMPTGGINAKNLTSYLDFKKIIACGGSWMVNKNMIAAKDWDGITKLTREAVSTMLGLTIKHVGINTTGADAETAEADKLAALFGVASDENEKSIFVNNLFEVMKFDGRGTHGHIAIQTNYIERAIYHLERRGFAFDEESKLYDANGNLVLIYLKDEIGGFGIHLSQK